MSAAVLLLPCPKMLMLMRLAAAVQKDLVTEHRLHCNEYVQRSHIAACRLLSRVTALAVISSMLLLLASQCIWWDFGPCTGAAAGHVGQTGLARSA